MKFSQARQGRIFILRLEDGEIVHEMIERFAEEQSIRAAALIAVGGADAGSRLVVGPEEGRSTPISPMELLLDNVHEVAGTGTLFPDEEGHPLVHMHFALGRKNQTVTGCIRKGVNVWHILEVIVFELLDTSAHREADPVLGFKLLQPE
jgi:predicted DNA-binding protein with PD1-like motif